VAVKTIYTCDRCQKTSENLDGWIEFSTDNGSLCVQNNLPRREFTSIANYECLHFCSSDCLVDRFIKRRPSEGRNFDILLNAMSFIASQSEGNWAVERAKVALEELKQL
jgi:hypothetical protein